MAVRFLVDKDGQTTAQVITTVELGTAQAGRLLDDLETEHRHAAADIAARRNGQ